MKRIICSILIIVIIVSLHHTQLYAIENEDSGTYYDNISGDKITIIKREISQSEYEEFSLSEKAYATCILVNDKFDEELFIDYINDLLIRRKHDGTCYYQKISDIVKITELTQRDNDQNSIPFEGNSNVTNNRDTDYVDNEPLTVSSTGVQTQLNSTTYSGYRAMGYRGGYWYAPSIYGYLQRKNAGVSDTYYSHLFSFSAGTTISTAASLIVAFFTSSGIALTISIAVAIFSPIIEVVTYDWKARFEVDTFRWNYRLRLNSNTGSIIYTTYRTKDYWVGYNPANGSSRYNYRGSSYDGGFPLSNTEMIKTGIDSYLE